MMYLYSKKIWIWKGKGSLVLEMFVLVHGEWTQLLWRQTTHLMKCPIFWICLAVLHSCYAHCLFSKIYTLSYQYIEVGYLTNHLCCLKGIVFIHSLDWNNFEFVMLCSCVDVDGLSSLCYTVCAVLPVYWIW